MRSTLNLALNKALKSHLPITIVCFYWKGTSDQQQLGVVILAIARRLKYMC